MKRVFLRKKNACLLILLSYTICHNQHFEQSLTNNAGKSTLIGIAPDYIKHHNDLIITW